LLAFWYSNQEICVRWKNSVSSLFTVNNGTRQGGVISPYLFSRYVRDMLHVVSDSKIGCNVGGMFCNILAYADDMVLLSPSWRAMQELLNILHDCIQNIDMNCNVRKTVAMVFCPPCKNKVVRKVFPCFAMNGSVIQYVSEFRYLGHVITNTLKDDIDIKREICNMFVRTNTLIRRFSECSVAVKKVLFNAFCMCLYGSALRHNYANKSMNKLHSCYNKCVKMFFGYARMDSVTAMLLELDLPVHNVLLSKFVTCFERQKLLCNNTLVQHIVRLGY
jgi:hypothetical protein